MQVQGTMRWVAGAALSASLALAGCGGGSTTATSAGRSASTGSSTSATMADVKVGDTVDFSTVAAEMTSAVQTKKTAHVVTAGSAMTVAADISYDPAAPRMSLTADAGGQQQMQILLTGGALYLSGKAFSPLVAGKKWVKISANGTDTLSKELAPIFSQMSSSMGNPAAVMAKVPNAKATVKSVDATGTTYAVTITKEQLQALESSDTAALGSLTGGALSQLPETLSYDYTVSSDHLPVRMVMKVGGSGVTMTFSKWGEPIRIQAPPASEVGTPTR